MSAGPFINTVYQATYNTAQIHKIRCQQESIDATISPVGGGAPVPNSAVLQATTSPISAQISQSARALGLNARLVYLVLPNGTTPPTGYKANSRTAIPALNPTFFTAAENGGTCDYLGATWNVAGTRQEKAR